MKKKLKGLFALVATVFTLGSTVVASGCSADFDKILCVHKWDEGKVTVEATCSKEGEKLFTCSECDGTKTEKVAKLPHVEKVVKGSLATCTKEGKTDGVYCEVCADWIVEPIVVNMLPHVPVVDPAVSETCVKSGLTAGYHCQNCEVVLTAQEVIPATGHDLITKEDRKASCFLEGVYNVVSCRDCGEQFSEETYTPVLEHSFVDNHCETCGMFDLRELLTMDETAYTAETVTANTVLEKGAIYRVSDESGNGDFDVLLGYSMDIADEWEDTYFPRDPDISCVPLNDNVKREDGFYQWYASFSTASVNDIPNGMSYGLVYRYKFENSLVVSEDGLYAYVYIPQSVFEDEYITIKLLAVEGMEKITLK